MGGMFGDSGDGQPQAQQQTPVPPSAQGPATHPRRAEVNARLHEQGREIHQQVKSGAMDLEEARHQIATDWTPFLAAAKQNLITSNRP